MTAGGSGLEADTALEPAGEGRWRGTIRAGWGNVPEAFAAGRSAPFGGYVSAFLVRALREAVGDEARAPRSLTVHFLAPPAPGPVDVAVGIERAGSSTTSASLRMEQGGTPVALALATAATWRDGEPEWTDATPPEVPAPEACAPVDPGPGWPEFHRRFEIRWSEPAYVAGRRRPRARYAAWVRPRPAMPLDHLAVTALADTMVPAAFTRLGRPYVVPTLDLTVHYRAPLPDPGSWALVAFSSRLSAGGTWEEDGEVWSRDGRLLAQSRQLAVIRG